MKLKTYLSLSAVSALSVVGCGFMSEGAIASPTTDAYGNWQSPITEETWIVTDRDPNGLNCRMRSDFGDIMFQYNNGERLSVLSMPVTSTIPHNTVVTVNPVDFEVRSAVAVVPTDVLFYDDRGLPWVFNVHEQCFVRANEAFIVPVNR